MPPRRLRRTLFPAFLLFCVLPLALLGWIGADLIRSSFLAEAVAGLTAQAKLCEAALAPSLAGRGPDLAARVRELAALCGARLTVVLPSGEVAADSEADVAQMGNHANREEIAAALGGRLGTSTRYSYTVRHDLLYLALPHRQAGRVAAVIRLAVPLFSLSHALARFILRLVLAGLFLAALTAGTAWWIAHRLSRPWEEIQNGAERFARGDLAARLPPAPYAEAVGLTQSLNQMAGQLDERLQTMLRQQDELEAVLTSMSEGVLAFDLGERLLNLNPTAARIFGLDPAAARGRLLPELIRNTRLQAMVAEVSASESPVEGDLQVLGEEERYLQAQGTALRDPHGRRIGVLLVLHDVTRLRRLETLRREFVANVSHELKTPITLLQGFIETLLEGALEQPADARRFLEIMAKQTGRLNAIIEDLLSLSRIEQDAERGQIALETADLAPVLAAAIGAFQGAADARRIRLELDCPDGLQARINRRLLEQAVANLIENAVKYGNEQAAVRVSAARRDGRLEIAVADEGPGIAAEHLPRLFERFYRIDRGRGRDAGGSGLGLAIVKHIVQAHGGRAEVASAPGQGSVFTLVLPEP